MKRQWLAMAAAAALAGCSDFVTSPTVQSGRGDLRAVSSPAPLACPAFWRQEKAATGVVLCSELFARNGGWVTDYVQIVDLKRGARVVSLFEDRSRATPQDASPTFNKKDLNEWWPRYSANPRLFCMSNGTFFESRILPTTRLSFAMRESGRLVTIGSGAPRSTLVALAINGTRADVVGFSPNKHDFATINSVLPGPDAVVGYIWSFAKEERNDHVFVAVADADRDGAPERVLIYTTPKGTPNEVGAELVKMQVRNIIQFDGGGSVQLRCNGTNIKLNSGGRGVPHVFVTLAGG